jgi:nicotinamidase-related amidase
MVLLTSKVAEWISTVSSSKQSQREALSSKNAALLLIDYQVELFQYLPVVEALKLKNTITNLATVGKHFNLPSLLTSHRSEGKKSSILPELLELLPKSNVIERDSISVWKHIPTVKAVAGMNRQKLIMSALDTTVGLSFAAIYAVQEGYDVYAVVDASFPFDELDRQAAMQRMAAAGVVVTTWSSVLANLSHQKA